MVIVLTSNRKLSKGGAAAARSGTGGEKTKKKRKRAKRGIWERIPVLLVAEVGIKNDAEQTGPGRLAHCLETGKL